MTFESLNPNITSQYDFVKGAVLETLWASVFRTLLLWYRRSFT